MTTTRRSVKRSLAQKSGQPKTKANAHSCAFAVNANVATKIVHDCSSYNRITTLHYLTSTHLTHYLTLRLPLSYLTLHLTLPCLTYLTLSQLTLHLTLYIFPCLTLHLTYFTLPYLNSTHLTHYLILPLNHT